MSNSPAGPRSRVARPSSVRLIVIAADVLIFLFFAIQGRAMHEMSLGELPVVTALAIMAPFAAPLFAVATLLGVYRTRTLAHPKHVLWTTALAWLLAGPIGLVLRAALLQRAVVLPFAAAALGIIGALLIAWHSLFSMAYSRRAGRQAHDG